MVHVCLYGKQIVHDPNFIWMHREPWLLRPHLIHRCDIPFELTSQGQNFQLFAHRACVFYRTWDIGGLRYRRGFSNIHSWGICFLYTFTVVFFQPSIITPLVNSPSSILVKAMQLICCWLILIVLSSWTGLVCRVYNPTWVCDSACNPKCCEIKWG